MDIDRDFLKTILPKKAIRRCGPKKKRWTQGMGWTVGSWLEKGTACAPGSVVLLSEVPSEEICEVSAKVSSCPSTEKKRFALDIGHTRRTQIQDPD